MAKQSLDELIEQSEEAIEKGEDLGEFEAEHHHKVKEEPKTKSEKVDEQIKKAKIKKSVSAEATPDKGKKGEDGREEEEKTKEIRDEKLASETTEGASKEETEEKKPAKKAKTGKAKIRSKKYQDAKALVNPNEKYDLEEGIELVKKTSMTKFDGNVEVHVRLSSKVGKPEQVRGLIKYPFSTGKSVKVIILDEALIAEIAKSQKTDFDIALATPALMPQVAKLAKILGPKGKMPNPKNGTVTTDPEKTKKEMEQGQTEYKTDSYGIIHQVIGKVSGKVEELEENYKTLIDILPNEKIKSINLCATMGPSVKVKK